MIPPHELDNLALTVAEAEECAEAGDFTEGRELLQGGLYRAEQLRDTGTEWGAALVGRYETALVHYLLRYGVRQPR